MFVSAIAEDAAEAVKLVRAQVPKGVLDWVQDFDAALEPELSADQRFDFRIYLIPHTGPKSEADASMTFIRVDELTAEQRAVVDQVRTIIREKHVPVEDLNRFKAGEVVELVAARLDAPFTTFMHSQAWKFFGVRPLTEAPNPAATKPHREQRLAGPRRDRVQPHPDRWGHRRPSGTAPVVAPVAAPAANDGSARSPYAGMGVVDDAEIEAHVRALLRQRAG